MTINFKELNENLKERDLISKYFKNKHNDILQGETCTKANFFNLLREADIIHIATHGKADLEQYNNSFIVFRSLHLEADSLYSYELYDKTIRAKLVVLTACETGIGKDAKGEGMFSIARGFAVAGVPTIAQSLWQINEGATTEVVDYFYENLSKDKKPVFSLTNAQKKYIERNPSDRAHPYYWSGLVMIVSSFGR